MTILEQRFENGRPGVPVPVDEEIITLHERFSEDTDGLHIVSEGVHIIGSKDKILVYRNKAYNNMHSTITERVLIGEQINGRTKKRKGKPAGKRGFIVKRNKTVTSVFTYQP